MYQTPKKGRNQSRKRTGRIMPGNTLEGLEGVKGPGCPRTGWRPGRSLALTASLVWTLSIPRASGSHWAVLRRVT